MSRLHLRGSRDAGELGSPHFVGNSLLLGLFAADAFTSLGFLALLFFRNALFFGDPSFFSLACLLGLALLFQTAGFFFLTLLFLFEALLLL